jgi:hypothetical protein
VRTAKAVSGNEDSSTALRGRVVSEIGVRNEGNEGGTAAEAQSTAVSSCVAPKHAGVDADAESRASIRAERHDVERAAVWKLVALKVAGLDVGSWHVFDQQSAGADSAWPRPIRDELRVQHVGRLVVASDAE